MPEHVLDLLGPVSSTRKELSCVLPSSVGT